MKSKTAVLVVDIQGAIVDDRPWRIEEMIQTVQIVIESARQVQTPVIYVRHNEEADSPLATGSIGWQIDSRVTPMHNEVIIDKWYNSAFKKTPLQAHLASMGVEHLIVMGLQTEYCIDATVKSAFDLGYDVIVPADCHSTIDTDLVSAHVLHELFSTRIWPFSFAKVTDFESVLEFLTGAE